MYPKNLKDVVHPAVRRRMGVERQIVTTLVHELLEQGFELAVMDGEEQHSRTRDATKVLTDIMNTDEDYLFVYQTGADDAETFGWVRLTYGNDGWDVMSDWTTDLDPYMPKTLALVDELS